MPIPNSRLGGGERHDIEHDGQTFNAHFGEELALNVGLRWQTKLKRAE